MKYGIIPEYNFLSCLKRYDLYHHFTADEHSFKVVRNLERLSRVGRIKMDFLARLYSEIPDKQVLFLAALLHDVGKIIMDEFVKEEYKLIHDEVQKGLSFELAEQKVLGTNHAEIGAKILQKWSFPDEIVLAVRHHHVPDAADPKSSLTDIVHIANVLCLMIGIGIGKEGLQYQPSELATQRLGLNQDQLEIVASQTLQWVDELSDVFGCH